MGEAPELTAVEVLDGFGNFFLRVHHERPAAHDGFMDGLTAEQTASSVASMERPLPLESNTTSWPSRAGAPPLIWTAPCRTTSAVFQPSYAERYAVCLCHGPECSWCHEALRLIDTTIDRQLPEYLFV